MNKIQEAKIKHNQLKIIKFCHDNEMDMQHLKQTVQLMEHQERTKKINLLCVRDVCGIDSDSPCTKTHR